MDQLRQRLKSCSEVLQPDDAYPCESLKQSRLVFLTQSILLALTASGKVFCIDIRPHKTSAPCPLKLSRPLPAESHSLLVSPCRQFLLVYGDRSLYIVHLHNILSGPLKDRPLQSFSGETLLVSPIAQSLFYDYPSLTILDSGFHPHSRGHVLILTSNSQLYVIDIYGADQYSQLQRIRLVMRGAPPVSFTFGNHYGWDYFSVFVMAEDGLIYVLCPVAPPGTEIPTEVWEALGAALPGLNKDGECDDSDAQLPMKRKFLGSFVAGKAGEMVRVRPDVSIELLSQGPIDVGRVLERNDAHSTVEPRYELIRTLPYNGAIPVLLRTNDQGQAQILVAEGATVPAWHGQEVSQYSQVAEETVQSMLCFESVSFPHRTTSTVIPLFQDGFYVCNGPSVLSLHVPWVQFLSQPDFSTENLPISSLRMILSTNVDFSAKQGIVGAVDTFMNGLPFAVIMTNTFILYPTQHLTFTLSALPSIPGLPRTVAEDGTSGEKEKVAAVLRETQLSTFPVEGLLCALRGDDQSVARLVEYLSNRLNMFNETTMPGLTSMKENIEKNITSLGSNLDRQQDRLGKLEEYKAIIEESALPVRNKLRRATALDANLRERMEILRRLATVVAPLSIAERERFKWLQERSRKCAALKRLLEELREAVRRATQTRAAQQEASESPQREPLPKPQRRGLFSSPFKPPSARLSRVSHSPSQSSVSRGQSGRSSPRSSTSTTHDEPYDISQTELDEITQALTLHAKEINSATSLAASLWKALSV